MGKKNNYVFICQSKNCLKRGSEHLRKCFKQSIKEKGVKKDFQVVNAKCMDACKKGPSIFYYNELHLEVDEKKIDEILNLYVVTHVGSD